MHTDESALRLNTSHAGLVLAAPFLRQLFTELGLMSNDRFIDISSSERAALLLHHCVAPDVAIAGNSLVLQKVLCGLSDGHLIDRPFSVSDNETTMSESMLHAVVDHWSALGHTSIDGLRNSFLIREGIMERTDTGWLLRVQPRAYDMLLDRLPWSITPVTLPWMDAVVQVQWR